jgi:hypothetical protein
MCLLQSGKGLRPANSKAGLASGFEKTINILYVLLKVFSLILFSKTLTFLHRHHGWSLRVIKWDIL